MCEKRCNQDDDRYNKDKGKIDFGTTQVQSNKRGMWKAQMHVAS